MLFSRYFLVLFFLLEISSANALSLEEYVNQVVDKNYLYQGSKMQESGLEMQSKIDKLVYSPSLFVTLENINDKRQTAVPTVQGIKTITHNLSSGISLLAPFGTEMKIYYSQSKNAVTMIPLSQPPYYNNGWNLQLRQPLWQNGFGAKVKAEQGSKLANVMLLLYTNKYQKQQVIMNAEMKFWETAGIVEKISVQGQAVDIAQKTHDLLSKKARNGLAEKSDLLQIKTYLETLKYNLESSLMKAEVSKSAFNILRGLNSADISDLPVLPNKEHIASLVVPDLTPERADIKVKEYAMKQAVANYDTLRETNKPQLDVVLKTSLTGRNSSYSSTMDEVNSWKYPYTYLALEFSIPLGVSNMNRVNEGYAMANRGAKLAYRQSLKEAESEISQLTQQFEHNKKLLLLSEKVVELQKKRVTEERLRYKLGKTTLYQLCLMETDYLTGRTNLIDLQQSVLALYSQIKTYAAARNRF